MSLQSTKYPEYESVYIGADFRIVVAFFQGMTE